MLQLFPLENLVIAVFTFIASLFFALFGGFFTAFFTSLLFLGFVNRYPWLRSLVLLVRFPFNSDSFCFFFFLGCLIFVGLNDWLKIGCRFVIYTWCFSSPDFFWIICGFFFFVG